MPSTTTPTPAPEYVLRGSEVAAMVPVDPATVRRYAARGVLPHRTLPSGERRYRLADVERVFGLTAGAR